MSDLPPALARLSASWNYPTAIRFGIGRIAELPEACRNLGMARPLPVTDPGLASLPVLAVNHEAGAGKLDLLTRVLGLPGNGYQAVMDWVLRLRERMEIPHTLAAPDVTRSHVPMLAPMAAANPSAITSPAPLDEDAWHRCSSTPWKVPSAADAQTPNPRRSTP